MLLFKFGHLLRTVILTVLQPECLVLMRWQDTYQVELIALSWPTQLTGRKLHSLPSCTYEMTHQLIKVLYDQIILFVCHLQWVVLSSPKYTSNAVKLRRCIHLSFVLQTLMLIFNTGNVNVRQFSMLGLLQSFSFTVKI